MNGMNVAVVRGHLSSEPTERRLSSGELVVQLEVTVRKRGDKTATVPVSWTNPPANAAQLQTGTEVVVLGHIRRRFFRAGGFTQSRTELVVERLIPTKKRSQIQTLLDQATARLTLEESRP